MKKRFGYRYVEPQPTLASIRHMTDRAFGELVDHISGAEMAAEWSTLELSIKSAIFAGSPGGLELRLSVLADD